MQKNRSRLAAIECLHELHQVDTPLPAIFQQIAGRYKLASRDRALAMNMVYGVLRQQQYLELLMKELCRMPMKKMHPLVRQALAVGLYQLIFLSRIPESAAVNETVNAVKAAGLPARLHGFVNGVLRQSIRMREKLPRPEGDGTPSLNVRNHPEWLTKRWAAHFGQRAMEAICRANNSPPAMTLRLNPRHTKVNDYLTTLNSLGIVARPGQYAENAILLPDFQGQVAELPGYGEGHFQVQGEAAQLVTLLLQPLPSTGRLLDGCAGVGGKSLHLFELAGRKTCDITAVEPEPFRQDLFQENMTRAGAAEKIRLFRGTLQEFKASAPTPFDGVLLDVPCSGTGVCGRQPDIRWRRTLADLVRFSRRQSKLLEVAASLVKPGGRLVYATCSLEPEENTEVVDHFLDAHDDFTLIDPRPFLPEAAAKLIRRNCFQPLPADGLDGFFGACLVRKSGDD